MKQNLFARRPGIKCLAFFIAALVFFVLINVFGLTMPSVLFFIAMVWCVLEGLLQLVLMGLRRLTGGKRRDAACDGTEQKPPSSDPLW